MATIAKWKAGERVPPRKSGKIKVGFSSMFFKQHASGKMIQGIIAGIDRDRFEVVVFCIKERISDPCDRQHRRRGLDNVSRPLYPAGAV